MFKISVAEFGEPDVMRLVEAHPPRLQPGQVLVRVHAAGVNPADTYIRAGTYAFFRPELPYTPGFDAAGTVEALGAGVTSVRRGDRVFVAALGLGSSGAYADAMVCDASAAHPLPAHVTFLEGAGIGVPWTTAFRALFQRGGLTSGETVLIHGASGGVGVPALQMAVAAGAVVIATAGTETGLSLVRGLGAAHALNHHTPGYTQGIVEATKGRGVDLVIEMLANQNLEADGSLLADRGRVVVVGSRGSIMFTPRLLMQREAEVRGMALWNMTGEETAEALGGVSRLLADKAIRPATGSVFDLADAAAAHTHIMSAPANGKCVLRCSGSASDAGGS
jgi:NADPH:quinone reductase